MSNRVPTYRRHKQSGQAVVTLTSGAGSRRDVLLGRHGTAASRQEYARVIAEWEANGRRLTVPPLSANDVMSETAMRKTLPEVWREPTIGRYGIATDLKARLRREFERWRLWTSRSNTWRANGDGGFARFGVPAV
jgi:hypothetical protein